MSHLEPRSSPDSVVTSSRSRHGVTEDAFLGGRLTITQPQTGYRAGLDAVVLAASVAIEDTHPVTLVDCGAGVGTVALSIARRYDNVRAVLVEKEPVFAELARRNADANGLLNRVQVVEADLTAPGDAMRCAGLKDNAARYVVANPPFFIEGQGTSSPNHLKCTGHEMAAAQLDLWVRFMARMTEARGTLYMIHQTAALPALLNALSGRFGDVKIVPIHARQSLPACRFLVSAKKGSRGPLKLLPGFELYGENDRYTAKAEAVLRDGAPLEFFAK